MPFTSKGLRRLRQATAKREFTVYLVPFNGGEQKVVKNVVAYPKWMN